MRSRALVLAATLAALAGSSPSAALAQFGFRESDLSLRDAAGSPMMQAGSHPYALNVAVAPTTEEDLELGEIPSGRPRDLRITLPPGLVGSPDATPECKYAYFSIPVSYFGGAVVLPDCPESAAVGIVRIETRLGSGPVVLSAPLYNLVHKSGAVARLGFMAIPTGPTVIDVALGESPPYALTGQVIDIPEADPLYSATMTVWGDPSSYQHDDDRGICGATTASGEDVSDLFGLTCETPLGRSAFLTSPRSCTGPLETVFEAEAWSGEAAKAIALTHDGSEPPEPLGMGGCGRLGFDPAFSIQPVDPQTDSHAGFEFDLSLPGEGLREIGGLGESDLEEIEVAMPAGTSLDAHRLESQEACTEGDFERESAGSELGEGCPVASRIASVEVETPLLEGALLKGSVFLGESARPLDYPIPLYMTIKEPERGVGVFPVGELWRDPESGQVGFDFYDLPQLPFSHLHLQIGANGPMATPHLCGAYEAEAALVGWADPGSAFLVTDSFTLDQGPGGGLCPSPEPGAPGGSSPSAGNATTTPSAGQGPLPLQSRCVGLGETARRIARRARRLRRIARSSRDPQRRRLRRRAIRAAKRARRRHATAAHCRARRD